MNRRRACLRQDDLFATVLNTLFFRSLNRKAYWTASSKNGRLLSLCRQKIVLQDYQARDRDGAQQ